ncbi:hypothetical protein CVT24_008491 [Panaeolus cyanescens]|uniref:Uncharacterized protein n=1 Tax=Panaeolus cyanescens TaxID=181874 RepID=A0A409YJC4_9AGAR|nr:hypothetical protein CVT24_008491 [Panaeolus cyanescens]
MSRYLILTPSSPPMPALFLPKDSRFHPASYNTSSTFDAAHITYDTDIIEAATPIGGIRLALPLHLRRSTDEGYVHGEKGAAAAVWAGETGKRDTAALGHNRHSSNLPSASTTATSQSKYTSLKCSSIKPR